MNRCHSSANSTSDDNNINNEEDRRPNGEMTYCSYSGNPLGCVTPLVLPQSRCLGHQNNQRSLTWNISLTDDQDEVSEHFLMMHNEPTTVAEQFGPVILKIPAYIRKEADELFKDSELDPNGKFDIINFKVSWILPSSYQQYLKSIPPAVLEKGESHVLYPWTMWNNSMTGTQHRSSCNKVIASPADSDSSFLHSSPMSVSSSKSHAVLRFNNNNNSSRNIGANNNNSSSSSSSCNNNSSSSSSSSNIGTNNNNNNSSSSSGNNNSSTSSSGDINNNNCNNNNNNNNNRLVHRFSEQMSCLYRRPADEPGQRFARNNNDRGGTQRPVPAWTALSLSDFDRSVSSSDSCHERLMPSPMSSSSSSSPSPSLSPSLSLSSSLSPPARIYYSVNANSNTVNKLVEHYCTFCYKNREPPEVYGSHLIRDAVRTTCPKLRALCCRHCNGTGDSAHTIKYCPFLYANYK